MNKIEIGLLRLIEKEPNKSFSVIITFEHTVNIENFQTKEFQFLMENIATASLKSTEIHRVSQNDNVIAIELDHEMEAF